MSDAAPFILTTAELPAEPKGWTRRLTLHFNFGSEGGAGDYDVIDAYGRETPIGCHYNTRARLRGFSLPGVANAMSWSELRERWPAWRDAELTRADGQHD